MQRCLAFAWLERVATPRCVETWVRRCGLWLAGRHTCLGCLLIGLTCAIVQAGDGIQDPSESIALPRVFRPSRRQSSSKADVSRKPMFDLRAKVATNGNLIETDLPLNDDAAYAEDGEAFEGRQSFSEIAKAQYTEAYHGEQLEGVFPPQPAATKPLSTEAVPLDGAVRDDGRIDTDENRSKATGAYSSLGWIPWANDRLGMVELDFSRSSRVRFDPTAAPETLIVLGGIEWGAKWLTGPEITDLPPQLFNILINCGSRFQLNERLSVDAMINPGWFTDFSNKGVQAFRLPWHVVTYYEMETDWYWVTGITDLDRDDIRYLPVIGMVLAPKGGDVRLDLVFPKPRIAWKMSESTRGERWYTFGENRVARSNKEAKWLTLGGELGGGSYAISRADRAYDVVTYRDYRLVAGIESKQDNGIASRLEAGWIFDRAVEYRSGNGNYSPPTSFMVRMSFDY